MDQADATLLQGCLSRWLRGMGFRIAIAAFVIGIIGGCVLVGVTLGSVAGLESDMVFLFSFLGGVGLTVTLTFAGAIYWMTRRSRLLDAVFAPYGMQGRSFMLSGRRFDGHFNGQPVEAYLKRGPLFELHAPANIGTTVSVGKANSLSMGAGRLLKREPFSILGDDFEGLIAYGSDEAWFQNIAEDERNRELVLALAKPAGPGIRTLQLRPDRAVLSFHRINPSSITDEAVAEWLPPLLELVTRIDTLPKPKVVEAPSELAANVRDGWLSKPMTIVAISIGLVVVFMGCFMFFALLIFALTSS